MTSVAFTAWGSPVTWLEAVAFALALAMVYFNLRVNPAAWPLAIASSLLYAWLFRDSKLYGEASLQLVFVAVALWGWWQWLRGTTADGVRLTVRTLDRHGRLAALGAMALLWPALALLLDHATDSELPWWDAFATAGSLVGQWLLGRKYVENWPTWVIVNAASIGLFAVRGLTLTVVLYTIFLGLSFAGWRAWHRRAVAA